MQYPDVPTQADAAAHPYQRLTPDLVLEAVESTGLACEASVFALNSYENRVYQVAQRDAAPVVVKFYRPQRWSQQQILEEHAFAAELADLEIPVVAPLRVDGVNSLYHHQGFDFAIFPRLPGRTPEFEDNANLRVIGRFIGRVHRCGLQRLFKYRLSLTLGEAALASRNFLLDNNFIPDSLREAYGSLSEHLIERLHAVPLALDSLQWLRLHGDCHPGNLLWCDGIPHFVDLDDALNGPAVQDLWMLLNGERAQQQIQLLALIEGYQEFLDFDARELILIEPLRTLRIMHYSAWLARRWQDPAFPMHFPWFNTERYWAGHVLQLREQLAALNEEPLRLQPW